MAAACQKTFSSNLTPRVLQLGLVACICTWSQILGHFEVAQGQSYVFAGNECSSMVVEKAITRVTRNRKETGRTRIYTYLTTDIHQQHTAQTACWLSCSPFTDMQSRAPNERLHEWTANMFSNQYCLGRPVFNTRTSSLPLPFTWITCWYPATNHHLIAYAQPLKQTSKHMLFASQPIRMLFLSDQEWGLVPQHECRVTWRITLSIP